MEHRERLELLLRGVLALRDRLEDCRDCRAHVRALDRLVGDATLQPGQRPLVRLRSYDTPRGLRRGYRLNHACGHQHVEYLYEPVPDAALAPLRRRAAGPCARCEGRRR
jgi:hypothetical protein